MTNMLSSKVNRKFADRKTIKRPEKHVLVDLKLDPRLKPLSLKAFKHKAPNVFTSHNLVSSLVHGETYAIGSGKSNDQVYYPGDMGLFGCVFEAWKNHWNLKTRPEDWWFPVACRIAKAVDKAAQRGSAKVRELFVSHDGKENIAIPLPVYTIYDANYNDLFSGISKQIEKKIKVPEYAKVMQNDFESSEAEHCIASQINLMSSVQQFFTYEMMFDGCGLRGLEMLGTNEDWEALPRKLQQVREILKPIQWEVGLYSGWWDHVMDVFQNLVVTKTRPNDPAVAKFWINILMETRGRKYIGGGGSMPGRQVEVKAYDGWLIRFLTDSRQILAEDLEDNNDEEVCKELSGWNQVPMKVTLTWCTPQVVDTSKLVAGIIGYVVHPSRKINNGKDGNKDKTHSTTTSSTPGREKLSEDNSLENVPTVEPNHMWAMLLRPNSPLRR